MYVFFAVSCGSSIVCEFIVFNHITCVTATEGLHPIFFHSNEYTCKTIPGQVMQEMSGQKGKKAQSIDNTQMALCVSL